MARHHSEENHAGHGHSHTPVITNLNNAFIIGIILNFAYVVIQIFVGLRIHSLALLSDAGHNFLDVAGLALAMLAFKLMKSKATDKYTYGRKKASILISLFNAVVLLISIGAIGYEAVSRFAHPQPLPGITIAVISGIGIVINGVSAFMFFKDKDSDINVKSTFLHLASDALVSFALVAGGVLIYHTHLFWIDPLLSLVVCVVIIANTWSLLKDSLRLSLDGVPENVEINEVKERVLKIAGVKNIHHLHIWAMSTTENAMTGHILLDNSLSNQTIASIKEQIKHELLHMNIQHVTLETEFEADNCEAPSCQ